MTPAGLAIYAQRSGRANRERRGKSGDVDEKVMSAENGFCFRELAREITSSSSDALT